MKTSKIILSAVLIAAISCSVPAFAATAAEGGDASESSEVSDSDSDSTDNYLELHMSGGNGEIEIRENGSIFRYTNIYGGGFRCPIPVGTTDCKLTITKEGDTIVSIKIGNSTEKRDCTKVSDTEYKFDVLEGDTDIVVVFASDSSESTVPESSAPAPSTPKPAPTPPTRPIYPDPDSDDYDEPATRESVPEPDTNPDTGIALAAAPAILTAAAVIVLRKKKK